MIKYLDQIALPDLYTIEDLSGRKYKSIDDWITKQRKNAKNKYFKKKIKLHMYPIRIVNHSIYRTNTNKYFDPNVNLTRDVVDEIIRNSDVINLSFNINMNAIEMIWIQNGLEDSFIDPKVYYDGLRIEGESQSRTTNYSTSLVANSNKVYKTILSNNMQTGKSSMYSIYLGYRMYDYIEYDESGIGILLDFYELSDNYGIVPIDYIESVNKIRSNGYERYVIDVTSTNWQNEIFYIDAKNEEDAIKVLYYYIGENGIYSRSNSIINSIKKLEPGEWF